MFYSDGLTEAENDDREEFGPKRLVEAWRRQEGDSKQAVEGILGEVAAFAGNMPQLDDQTLLIINVNEIK